MEKILQKHLDIITKKHYARVLRIWDEDIDILWFSYEKLKWYFLSEGFTCYFDDGYKLKFYYYLSGKIKLTTANST